MGSKERMISFLEQQEAKAAEDGEDQAARRRVLNLLDPDSFVELDSRIVTAGPLPGGQEAVPGDGLITGYGQIDGRLVFTASQDASVMAGSIGRTNSAKLLKALTLAEEALCPFIFLLDSGGLRVGEGLSVLDSLGMVFQGLSRASESIPVITLVLGPCPGTLSLIPAASDIVILAEDKGGIFMQGPGITAAVESPDLKPADIGGAEVHSRSSGLASFTAPDEEHALELARRVLSYIPDNAVGFIRAYEVKDDPNRSDAHLDELASGLEDGYAMDEVLESVFDRGSVLELHKDFAPDTACGLALLGGEAVIYAANREPEMSAGAVYKLEKLLRFAGRMNYPLITFTDTTGFRSGIQQEKDGISSAAARVMQAFSQLQTVSLNVIIGQAVGAGYLLFNSRTAGADLVYAWPTAEISVLAADPGMNLFWRERLAGLEDPVNGRARLLEEYRSTEMNPARAASAGAVDEVIRPSATRPRLYSALQVLRQI